MITHGGRTTIRFSAFTLSIPLILAAVSFSGCHAHTDAILGAAPAAAATATVKQLAQMKNGTHVTLQGEMVEKCPISGCWFMLKDKTGVVRVDTKASGFVVAAVPLHSNMTVSGEAVAGNQPGLNAAGVRY
jgi:uncharacterized protein YdeI (BOF family)